VSDQDNKKAPPPWPGPPGFVPQGATVTPDSKSGDAEPAPAAPVKKKGRRGRAVSQDAATVLFAPSMVSELLSEDEDEDEEYEYEEVEEEEEGFGLVED